MEINSFLSFTGSCLMVLFKNQFTYFDRGYELNGLHNSHDVYLGFVHGIATKVIVKGYDRIIEVHMLEDIGNDADKSTWHDLVIYAFTPSEISLINMTIRPVDHKSCWTSPLYFYYS